MRANRPNARKVGSMLADSLHPNVAPYDLFGENTRFPRRADVSPSLVGGARASERLEELVSQQRFHVRDRPTVDTSVHAVEIDPPDVVNRRTVKWHGMAAEIVQATRREKMEFRFRAPVHLLAVCDQGTRIDGDTYVEGLPRSKLRDVKRKLTFVPAGHEYREWHEPCVLSRVVYFYFDPAKMPKHLEGDVAPAPLTPRLLFEDATLSDTALKLKRLIECPGADSGRYFEALGVVLAHELIRLNAGAPRIETPVRGGL